MNETSPNPDQQSPPPSPPRRRRLRGWRAQRIAANIVVGAVVLLAAWAITVEVAMWRGAACLEARRHERALLWLRLADVMTFRNAELHYLLARCHRRLGEFADVEFHLTRAHELGWDVNQLKREQWLALAQTGRYDQIKPYWPILFQNPGSDGPEICEAYVTAAFGLFLIQDALEVLGKWEAEYPDDARPHIMRARLAETRHKWGNVVTHYRRALQLAPDRTDVQFGLAKALMKQAENDEAEELLRRVIRDEPEHLAARLSYAEHMAKLNRRDDARKALQYILNKEPDDVDALSALGNVELASGRPRAALPSLQRAARLKPENRDVAYAYARALQAEDRSEEARGHFEFVGEATKYLARRSRLVDRVFMEPENLDLRFEVAMITWQYKSRDDGAMWWRCLLKIDPHHAATHAALAHHYELIGDRRLADHHRQLAGDVERKLAGHPKLQELLADLQSDPRGLGKPRGAKPAGKDHDRTVVRKQPIKAGRPSGGMGGRGSTAGSLAQTPAKTKTAAWFVDVAPEAGVEFVPRNGREANQGSILETLGVGAALFDYDGDDDLDVFVPGGGYFSDEPAVLGLPPAMFRNEGDWKFTEVTGQADVAAAPFYSHAAVVGDYDNDGMPDLLVTGYGGLLLYRNNGDGTFTDVAGPSGLNGDRWNCGAAWGDVNADGNLDLYVVRYVDWSFQTNPYQGPSPDERVPAAPEDFNPISDRFYLGKGDGTFRDATDEVGLVEGGKGLAVLAADFDLDGDLDYYVTNDTTPNLLYRNDGKGRLEEIGIFSGAGLGETGGSDGSMGVDLGDFDLDGKPDLWVANFEDQSFALYHNQGNCIFHHASARMGISRTRGVYVGFGTVFFDFDRDGDEDLFVSNGHVRYHAPNAPYRQVPLLFENRGGTQFVNVAQKAGPYTSKPHVGRGVAMGDVDRDGDVDLVVTHTGEPIAFLSNRSKSNAHWLRLRLIGVASNRDGVGARVRVRIGDRWQTRQVKGGTSYFSSNDPGLFFGIGRARTVDRVEIDWPSGRKQTLSDVKAGRTVVVRESVE